MCGITGIILHDGREIPQIHKKCLEKGIYSRGEITEEVSLDSKVFILTRRLKIVDPEAAIQPMLSHDRSLLLVFNGEIFNYKELRDNLVPDYPFQTKSDTEVLIPLYQKYGLGMFDYLRGQWAFHIYNLHTDQWFCARDELGIVPYYYVLKEGVFYFSSTIKSLTFLNTKILVLPPGHWMDQKMNPVPYIHLEFSPVTWTKETLCTTIQNTLDESIRIRVDTDLAVGVIYSGGIDSTIVLDRAIKYHNNVTAFTIGMPDSEDVAVATQFCQERNIPHVIVPFHESDCSLAAIAEAIRMAELTEYLDIINAVISMKLFRAIRERKIKVVLCGDGSDELFAGYTMYDRIDSESLDQLYIHKICNLHRTELQRIDRVSGAYTIETRVPFLDIQVLNLALQIGREWKIRDHIEKWCLRESYSQYLPDYILNRRKNPLSHSSGLHELVRMKKLFFRKYYIGNYYHLHEPIRKDFSVILLNNNYDYQKSITEENKYADYSFTHHIIEMLKSIIRWYLLNPRFITSRHDR